MTIIINKLRYITPFAGWFSLVLSLMFKGYFSLPQILQIFVLRVHVLPTYNDIQRLHSHIINTYTFVIINAQWVAKCSKNRNVSVQKLLFLIASNKTVLPTLQAKTTLLLMNQSYNCGFVIHALFILLSYQHYTTAAQPFY